MNKTTLWTALALLAAALAVAALPPADAYVAGNLRPFDGVRPVPTETRHVRAIVSAARVAVDGTTFRIRGGGMVLPQDSLVGTVIVIDDGDATLALRIDAVEQHERDADITLYELSVHGADGAWHNVCMPGPDGRKLAFPLSGVWSEDGDHANDPGRFNIACAAGPVGTCVAMGHKPWQGDSMAADHQACVRTVMRKGS